LLLGAILSLQFTKNRLAAPLGELEPSPDSIAAVGGSLLKGGEGKGGDERDEGRRERERRGGEGKRREGKGRKRREEEGRREGKVDPMNESGLRACDVNVFHWI